VLRGIVAHLAPTLPFVVPEQIYGQIAAAARDAGFEEIWSLPEVLNHWESDHQRWQWVCEHIDDLGISPGRVTTVHKGRIVQAADVYDPSVPPWE
jgi:hypothetical protein